MAGFSGLTIDAGLAENGVVVDIGNGKSIKVARMGNKNFNRKLLAATKRYGQHGWKALSREKQDEEYVKAMVGTVLLGWQGYPVEFSEDEAVKVLLDPSEVVFRELVESLASEPETFRSEQIEETVKN